MRMEPDRILDSNSTGLSGTKRVREGSEVIKKVRVSEQVDDDDQEEISRSEDGSHVLKMEIDVNVPVTNRNNISSADEKLGKSRYDHKGKGIEESCHRGLEINEGNGDVSSPTAGGKRYTREEKGKEKADANSQGSDFGFKSESDGDDQIYDQRMYTSDEDHQIVEAAMTLQSLLSVPESQESSEEMPVNEEGSLVMHVDLERERVALERERIALEIRERRAIYDKRQRIERAREFAQFDSNKNKRVKLEASKEAEMTLEDLSGPFSIALKAIQDRNTKQSHENLIRWNANTSEFPPRIVPSLLDLSLDILVRNADAIYSFDHVPEQLKQRFANLLCDSRKMDIRMLELFVKGSPTEIHVKDCSWMTEAQLIKISQKLDTRNLRVLQLDLCGQFSFDDIITKSLAQSPNSLPCLGILSLRGAGRLSDNTLKPLLMSAPLLQSINLSQCALLTSHGIKILAHHLKENLRELYIDDCPRIDAMCLIPSMKKFEHLEVLSVAGIQTVCDEFVRGLVAACGANIKELNLANCLELTNGSLEAIGNHCPPLCSLNISNLPNLTDFSICYLANGCRSLQSLKIDCADFSDEVVAAFLETSGGSLNELSLNKVCKITFNTALSLAKCSRKLTSLDLSWCRKITNEALGLIVDSCSSLRLLKLFGCTQISDKFPYSHANSQVRIVGLNQTPLLQHVTMFEPVGVLLRHSPLKSLLLP